MKVRKLGEKKIKTKPSIPDGRGKTIIREGLISKILKKRVKIKKTQTNKKYICLIRGKG